MGYIKGRSTRHNPSAGSQRLVDFAVENCRFLQLCVLDVVFGRRLEVHFQCSSCLFVEEAFFTKGELLIIFPRNVKKL